MMKKVIFRIIIFVTLLLVSIINVKAADFSTTIDGSNTVMKEQEFTLTFGITGGTNLTTITGNLTYDSTKLTLVSSEGLNGFDAVVGTEIVSNASIGKTGTFNFLTITFKGTSTFSSGTTTVSFTTVTGFNGANLAGENSSKVISIASTNNNLSALTINDALIPNFDANKTAYEIVVNNNISTISISATVEDSTSTATGTGSKNLAIYSNTFEIAVTSQSGAVKKYKIIIIRKDDRGNTVPSTNNSLSSLKVNGVSVPNFDAGKTSYEVTVNNGVTQALITATTEDDRAVVTGLGSKNLVIYNNIYKIVVKSQANTQKTYTITIIRKDEDGRVVAKSSNSKLKSLVIKDYDIEFDKNVLEYSFDVAMNVTKLEIDAVVEDNKAVVSIDNADKLNLGKNVITVLVTAENETTSTYVLNVTRKDTTLIATFETFAEVLEELKDRIMYLDIKDNNMILPETILKAIKDREITIVVRIFQDEKIIYSWTIDGKNVVDIKAIDLTINFDQSAKTDISKIINEKKGKYFNLIYDESFPKDTKLKINLDQTYANVDELGLYRYDNNDFTFVKRVLVNDGTVELAINNNDLYALRILEDVSNKDEQINYTFYVIVGGIGLIVLVLVYFVIKKIIKKKSKDNVGVDNSSVSSQSTDNIMISNNTPICQEIVENNDSIDILVDDNNQKNNDDIETLDSSK